MDEAQYNMKYYVDRRGRHMSPRIQRRRQITPRCTVLASYLAVFEYERMFFFFNLFFVFSLTVFVGNSPVSSSLKFSVLW